MENMKKIRALAVLLLTSYCCYAQTPETFSGTFTEGVHELCKPGQVVVSPTPQDNLSVSGSADVVVRSATGITLKPGFHAGGWTNGGGFIAKIDEACRSELICGSYIHTSDTSIYPTDSVTKFVDQYGNQYKKQELIIQGGGGNHESCQAGLFTLFFNDVIDPDNGNPNPNTNNGVDFGFANAALGQARRDLVCRVFSDVSAMFNHPPFNDGRVRIRINYSINDPADPRLAVAGIISNYPGTLISGILHNEVNKTIVMEQDSYNNTPNQGQNLAHGNLTINFSRDYYLDADNDMTIANNLEFDFYTLVLHEVLHLLGISSAINQNGSSLITNGTALYSAFDQFLTNDNAINPFLNITNGFLVNYNPGANTTSGCINPNPAEVHFDGTNTFDEIVDSPNPWSEGSSLSHFLCWTPNTGVPCPSNNDYVIKPCMGQGMTFQNRHPNQVEYNTLCDLGYQLTNQYSYAAQTSTYFDNYLECSMPECFIYGVNDFYTVPFGTISFDITDFLNNDVTNGTVSMFDQIQLNFGGGNANLNGTTITYNNPNGYAGWVAISYIPNCENDEGYITTIFLWVEGRLPCPPVSCDENIVCGGDLEIVTDDNIAAIINFRINDQNTPDLYINSFSQLYGFDNPVGCGGNLLNPAPQAPDGGANYIGIASVGGNQELSTPLPDGTQFQFSFLGHGKTTNCSPTYNFYLSENPPCGLPGVWNCPSFDPTDINNTIGWTHTETLITADWQLYPTGGPTSEIINSGPNPMRFLTIVGESQYAYGYLDNISIIPELTPLTITSTVSDNTPCPGQEFTIEYEICNMGTLTVENMQFWAELPYGFDSDNGGGFDDFGVSGFIDLDPNECAILILTVTADPEIAGTTSTITLNSQVACANTEPPSDDITILPDILTIEKTVTNGSAFTPGDVVNYEIEICNTTSQDDITNVEIIDDVPILFTTIFTTDFAVNGNLLTKNIATLTPGCITYNFSATINPNLTNCDDELILSNCAVVSEADGACILPSDCEDITINFQSESVESSFSIVAGTICLDAINGVEFTNASVSGVSYLWQFGDGSTSTNENPLHVYTNPGWYQVVLYAFDACGNTDESHQVVFIYPECCSEPSNFSYTFPNDIIIPQNTNVEWVPGNINFQAIPTASFNGTIWVRAGATLELIGETLPLTLSFGPLGRIVVERGGNLQLSKTVTLTSISPECPVMWQGIEVWGNSQFNHSLSNLPVHGEVFFQSGGSTQIVENAHIGVLLGRRYLCFNIPPAIPGGITSGPLCKKLPWQLGFSGGIIDAQQQGLQFRNNGNDIRFVSYPFNNIGNIRNSEFEGGNVIDEGYDLTNSYTYPNPQNIWMANANDEQRTTWGINNWGVNLVNSIFQNTFDDMEEGIRSFDARYNLDQNSFTNMDFGVRIFSTNSSINSPHFIARNNFNRIGVEQSGTNQLDQIMLQINGNRGDYVGPDNDFGDEFLATVQANNDIGLLLNNASAYRVIDNRFNKLPLGVWAVNSNKWFNIIRNRAYPDVGNQFLQNNIGLFTWLDNRRLQIKCDNWHNNVPSDYGVNWNVWNRLANQAQFHNTDNTRQAGNEFTPEDKKKIQNIVSPFNPNPIHFTYNSHKFPFARRPEPDGNITMTAHLTFDQNYSCPYNLTLGPIVHFMGEISNKTDIVNDLKIEYETVFENLDSGRTSILFSAIADTLFDKDSLKIQMLDASPLSDSVLIATLQRIPKFSDMFYLDILLANSPLTEYVLVYLDKKTSNIHDTIIDSIISVQGYPSSIRTLKAISNDIENYTIEKQQILSGLVFRLVENDSLLSAMGVMLDADSLEAGTMQAYISTLLELNSFNEALNRLNNFEPQNSEDANWKTFTNLLLQLKQDSLSVFEMSEAQEITVRNIAAVCPPHLAAVNAQSILRLVYNEETAFDIACGTGKWDGFEFTNQSGEQPSTSEKEEALFKLYPNPANQNVKVLYHLDKEQNGRLEVYTISGVLENVWNLSPESMQVTLSTTELRNGIYLCRFIVEGEMEQTQKFIIIHD